MTPAPRNIIRDSDISPLTITEIDALVSDVIDRDTATPTQEPGRARRSRFRIAAAGIAATAAVFTALSVSGAVPNTRAVAWSAVPAAPSTVDLERHGQQCINFVTSILPTDDSVGNELLPPTPTPTPPRLRVELSEDRNGSNATLLSNGSFCLLIGDSAGPSASYITLPSPRPNGDRIALADYSFQSSGNPVTEGSDEMEWESFRTVIYLAGPNVAGAVITTDDGTEVTATVANGWILAWWPTDTWWPTDDNPEQAQADEDTITITTTTGDRYSEPIRRK